MHVDPEIAGTPGKGTSISITIPVVELNLSEQGSLQHRNGCDKPFSLQGQTPHSGDRKTNLLHL
jgi:hypothetical protein